MLEIYTKEEFFVKSPKKIYSHLLDMKNIYYLC